MAVIECPGCPLRSALLDDFDQMLDLGFEGVHLRRVRVRNKLAHHRETLNQFRHSLDEQHGETDMHYGCELGDLHFAIHPLSNFEGGAAGVGAVKLAFTVFNIEAFVQKVKSKGFEILYPPKDTGFSIMTALKDPDGNYIEFTQLSRPDDS